MKRLILLLAAALSITVPLAAKETPNTLEAQYAAPAERVFTAALASIQNERYEVRGRDELRRTIDFHVGVTALSWGYNMKLEVTPIDAAHARVVIAVTRTGGKIVSWGSGKKQAQNVLSGIEAELAAPTSR